MHGAANDAVSTGLNTSHLRTFGRTFAPPHLRTPRTFAPPHPTIRPPDGVQSLRMSKLIYITNASLDGYIEDRSGDFDWVNSDRVFDAITDLLRPIGTHLLGRRLYETMAFWDGPVDGYPPEHREFARIWQQAETIVFSRTLTGVPARIARVEREFDAEAIRALKRDAKQDIMIGGAELAGIALESSLVDECHLFLHPVIVGGGKPAFRAAGRRDLDLLETRRFDSGVIHVRYRVRGATP